jgi:hypothetical protein
MAPRKSKKDAVASESSETADVPATSGGVEKKARKPNSWNVYYKAEYAKYKSDESHKGKTHSQLTDLIKEEYKLKKEKQSVPSASTEQSE